MAALCDARGARGRGSAPGLGGTAEERGCGVLGRGDDQAVKHGPDGGHRRRAHQGRVVGHHAQRAGPCRRVVGVAVGAERERGKQEPTQEENAQRARTPVSKHPQHRLAK